MFKIPLLWIDSSGFFNVIPVYQKRGFDVTIVKSGKSGFKTFNMKKFFLVITDIMLKDIDGFEVFSIIRRKNKDIPIVACSAFVDQEPYRTKITNTGFSFVFIKPIPIVTSEHFAAWINKLKELALEYQKKDPFYILFDEFKNMPLKEQLNHKRIIWNENKQWILNEIKKRKAKWIMILGGIIERYSNTLDNFPTEKEIESIGRKSNLVPFIYMQSPIIEESNWNYIKEEDYYPTINLSIENKENGKEERKLIGDFDTGAELTHISDEIIPINIFSLQAGSFIKEYEFSVKKLDIIIESEFGKKIKKNLPIASVFNWKNSSFIIANSNRKILVGRDVLQKFPLTIELNFFNKISKMYINKSLSNILIVFEKLINIYEKTDSFKIGHSAWVSKYSELIAKKISLSNDRILLIKQAALLHDIGKIAIPTNILTKTTNLTNEELELLKSHTSEGKNLLLDFLEDIAYIIECHHERYDGKGYPYKKSKNEIPLEARIIAVPDVFNAMTSYRCFRPPKSKQDAIDELKKGQFDPLVVEAFIEVINEYNI